MANEVTTRKQLRSARIRKKFPDLKTKIDKEFHEELSSRWPNEPSFADPISQMCTFNQVESDQYKEMCSKLKIKPIPHRKNWEFCFIAQTVEKWGKVGKSRSGIGFGVGTERLPSYFASKGCHILSTDIAAETEEAGAWSKSNQHAKGLESCFHPKLISEEEFRERVRFRPVDMNDIPADIEGHDFCWSSCALEHLGSLQNGLDFISNSIRCLKPGGIAVHTTEFNLGSFDETLKDGPCVVYREKDIVEFARLMKDQGFNIDLNLNPGSNEPDRFVDAYRDNDIHLRLYVRNSIAATSIGLTVAKPA